MNTLETLTEDLDKEKDYCIRAIRFLEGCPGLEPDKYPEQRIEQYFDRLNVLAIERARRLKNIFGL